MIAVNICPSSRGAKMEAIVIAIPHYGFSPELICIYFFGGLYITTYKNRSQIATFTVIRSWNTMKTLQEFTCILCPFDCIQVHYSTSTLTGKLRHIFMHICLFEGAHVVTQNRKTDLTYFFLFHILDQEQLSRYFKGLYMGPSFIFFFNGS